MDRILSIKNRYWMAVILPLILFLVRYYLYFQLREPAVQKEGLNNVITFKSFFVYNYLLGVAIMFVFLLLFFLLLKGISFLWQDFDNRKLLKIVLVSYLAFFIPEITQDLYFTFVQPDFSVAELHAFSKGFHLDQLLLSDETANETLRLILRNLDITDFIFFFCAFLLFRFHFPDLPSNTAAAVTSTFAIVYLSFYLGIFLLAFL